MARMVSTVYLGGLPPDPQPCVQHLEHIGNPKKKIRACGGRERSERPLRYRILHRYYIYGDPRPGIFNFDHAFFSVNLHFQEETPGFLFVILGALCAFCAFVERSGAGVVFPGFVFRVFWGFPGVRAVWRAGSGHSCKHSVFRPGHIPFLIFLVHAEFLTNP